MIIFYQTTTRVINCGSAFFRGSESLFPFFLIRGFRSNHRCQGIKMSFSFVKKTCLQFQIETFIEFFMNLWEIYRIQTCPKLLNIISFHEFISFLGVIESRSCFEKWCRWRKGWNRQIVVFRWCHGHRWFSQVDFRSKRYEILAWLQINTRILEFFTWP